jgi:hypothetical protein
MKNLCELASRQCGFVAFLYAAVVTAQADIGTGSNKPLTPYEDPKS